MLDALDRAAREFSALDEADKATIAMARGGPAWRGWFPLGGELTSGRPDGKEGVYFGRDAEPDVRPLHGRNLYPREPGSLRPAVDAWMSAMEQLAARLMRSIALGLGLDADWFARELTLDPVVLFRIFRYPPLRVVPAAPWSVAEHTDYGLITPLAHDGTPGLEVRVHDE